jgi:hydroxymethylglutaryl-CoA reductase (NADPH)
LPRSARASTSSTFRATRSTRRRPPATSRTSSAWPRCRSAWPGRCWLKEHFDGIKEAAETTTRSGRLRDIEQYTASRILFTRFNYTTGDAAGQNLTGKATAAAVFIATGQDVANVAESSAAFVYAELRPNGNYYYSVTIPSLIVATYGGGNGLPTQRECLELLDCYGTGKVRKFAEIVAATVLCGELSLGSAIVAEEWVEAHDLLGRNRP